MTLTTEPSTRQSTLETDTAGTPLLALHDLSVRFPKRYGQVSVLDRVNLAVHPGEAVAVVGESGCGKSLLGLAAANLLPRAANVSGTVEYRGKDMQNMSGRQQRRVHGAGVSMIYQDAMTSLNPGMTTGAQLRQVCRLGASSTPEELLVSVGLTETERIMRARPHQLSGGQRQRVLIAIALARDPELIIADEPTTALDVTIQKQIVELLKRLQTSRHFALIFISHDLGLVSQVTQRTIIMYAGHVVESGPTNEILRRPRHPYTGGLLRASVSLEQHWATLAPIPGFVRQPLDFLPGCRFRDRCPNAADECASRPTLESDGTRDLACYHPLDPGTLWPTADGRAHEQHEAAASAEPRQATHLSTRQRMGFTESAEISTADWQKGQI